MQDQAPDLDPFLRESIAHLGWIEAEAIPRLLDAMGNGRHWTGWRNPEQIVREGDRIGPDDRVSLGLDRHGPVLTWQAWNMLSEAGRQDPRARFDAAIWRAIGNARRSAQQARDRRMLDRATAFVGVKVGPPPGAGLCLAGLALAGSFLTDVPSFPRPDCTAPVCHCSWRLVSAWEARRDGLG